MLFTGDYRCRLRVLIFFSLMLILTCSSIIQKFVSDHLKGSSNVEKFGGPTGYDDLLQCKDIDAIYVPLPTVLKKEWAIKVLQAGKHCMIEKPVAMTADDYQQVLDAAYKAQEIHSRRHHVSSSCSNTTNSRHCGKWINHGGRESHRNWFQLHDGCGISGD